MKESITMRQYMELQRISNHKNIPDFIREYEALLDEYLGVCISEDDKLILEGKIRELIDFSTKAGIISWINKITVLQIMRRDIAEAQKKRGLI